MEMDCGVPFRVNLKSLRSRFGSQMVDRATERLLPGRWGGLKLANSSAGCIDRFVGSRLVAGRPSVEA